MDKNLKKSFLFYDYETFGKDPALDKPAQFASIRTNENFNITEDPKSFYCIPPRDYLPNPEAVMITGITPQYAKKYGINEAQFSKHIHNIFNIPNSCILGYNNINFDDEITRNIFYRNFYDPYDYIWKNNNSRWDLLNLFRASYALRPNGINWPKDEQGNPNFKLQNLTASNDIKHQNAHNAISDVLATIEMAKLIKNTQPKMFKYFFKLRKKKEIIKLINISEMTPLIYVSGIFGNKKLNTSLISPIIWHPTNKNSVIVYDLSKSINSLLTLNVNKIKKFFYTKKTELINKPTIPIKIVQINKCPILAPINILNSENIYRIRLNLDNCMNNLSILKKNKEIKNKIFNIFNNIKPFTSINDVDTQIYSKFFSKTDLLKFNIIRDTPIHKLSKLNLKFNDTRITELFFRYRARNYPKTLTKKEQIIWIKHCINKFSLKKITKYFQKINELFITYKNDKKKIHKLQKLVDYAIKIITY